MKVKELLARIELENPESVVVPEVDEGGSVKFRVLPPANSFGEPVHNDEGARTVLGGHIDRVETIRLAVGSFYGLPVHCNVETSPSHEWVQFLVKSPTGKTVAIVDISPSYVLRENDLGLYQDILHDLGSGSAKRFNDLSADLTGYRCQAHKYVFARESLQEAIQKLCEAPKWLEIQRKKGR